MEHRVRPKNGSNFCVYYFIYLFQFLILALINPKTMNSLFVSNVKNYLYHYFSSILSSFLLQILESVC